MELVAPTAEDSTMSKFLTEKGQGIHHLCLETDDIEAMLADLKAKGFRLINETPIEEPGRKMAFVHPKGNGWGAAGTLRGYQIIRCINPG